VSGATDAVAGPGDAAAWLEREREIVDVALQRIAEGSERAVAPGLRSPVAYALSTRGKRLRPILAAAAFRCATRTPAAPDAAYRLGCAVEMVHTYSLVHDDLPCMDDDDLRRGRPTAHRVHGVASAVLAGAALLPLAIGVLVDAAGDLHLQSPETGRLVQELCAAAGAEGMVGGQLRDLEGERRTVAADELEAIHRAKTGALLTAALRIGALAGRCDSNLLASLTRYGQALGLAFQITDDVLDVAGDSDALGKPAGRDEALSKASYPALYGIDAARELARERADEARAALADVDAPDLVALADYVVARER
jgi:geranylgeranyl pyrophosphate synthase